MSNNRSIPSLDGLRALSVMLVIFMHSTAPFSGGWRVFEPLRNAGLGVTFFFVISGLLITKLLLNEIDTSGTVSLGSFYARRSFRIFPPFYVFLLVIGVLSLLHIEQVGWKSFLYAAAYLWNYAPHAQVEILDHTWSLSLEEQFYLLWPACLFFFKPRTCLRIAGWATLLSPLLRVATYALVPSMRDHIDRMLHTRLDAIMVGAFLALAQHQRVFQRLLALLARPICLLPALLYFLAQPFLVARFKGAFILPLGFSLDAITCGVVLLFATQSPQSLFGRALNLPWLRHIGIISYSLYLWQQLFTGHNTRLFPLNLIPIVLCAEASYWLIEKPSFRLRNRFMRKRAPVAKVVEVEPRSQRTIA